MPIRRITTTEALEPWLPSDYRNTTPWNTYTEDGQTVDPVQEALDAGYHPRLIAAEIWEEWAMAQGKTDAEVNGEKVVTSWQNGEVSVEYATNHAPREFGFAQARHHRSRGPVRNVRLAHRLIEGEEPTL